MSDFSAPYLKVGCNAFQCKL